MDKKKPVVLVILDGWGVAPPSPGNAITIARTPVFDALINEYPRATIQAAGEAVGLPWQNMGNSEVGHMNIGSGRIMYQELPLINKAIRDGSFFENQSFKNAVRHVKRFHSKLHLMGLLSKGGVHAQINHIYALLELAKRQGLRKVYLHLFLDGRDAPKDSALDYLTELTQKMKELGIGEIASITGRFYAMDRDRRWDRVQKAYDVLIFSKGKKAGNPIYAVKKAYQQNVFDEEFPPTVVTKKGEPVARIDTNDALIFFNFRADRARQLSEALTDKNFNAFKPVKRLDNLYMVTMTKYNQESACHPAYVREEIKNTLGEVISRKSLKQVRIAETEKYAHVTYFFNCGRIDPYKNEMRELVSSPPISSYARKPEMSAPEVTKKACDALKKNVYDFYCINIANPDMVGHTGELKAAILAVESADRCLGKIVNEVIKKDGLLVVTADHGNAEVMIDLISGDEDKEHTAFPVPFIFMTKDAQGKPITSIEKKNLHSLAPIGVLADVAPTILESLALDIPEEMTGISLINTIL
ncbi:2,3-bisphosphoglycerate-independent phosphoglycerate mutase [Patescibacteria group bacterium]|nr:2,3-bisphosphoglycerate-independent phosphoglycerate mutase [Patescibacteria group bacterium]